VFREFETNVKKDLLANSWTPTNLNAKYPRIDVNDTFSRALSSFYVKDGSYTRLRNLQIGYTLPSTASYLPGARVYVQGDNLFTITNYEGLDPSLPAANITGAAGDVRDQGLQAGEVPVQRGGGHAQLAGDGAQGDRGRAAVHDELAGHLLDLLQGGAAVPLAAGGYGGHRPPLDAW